MNHRQLASALLTALISTSASAAEYLTDEEAQAAYATTDLEQAVEDARETSDRSEYVGYEWYNRTTSKSFPLARMLNTEMDGTVVEGAMGPTAAGEAAAEEASRPVRDNALGRDKENDDLIDVAEGDTFFTTPQPVVNNIDFYVGEYRSSTNTGEMLVRETRAIGSVTSVQTPGPGAR
ncbi:MAG TPA: hypothetical protein DEA26_10105 [Oceanospirillales bacterium]|nr:hypothetical protein [Oceanospirillaceae bacterium]HBS43024.1 hypothetical protein [Oceanospirillales bacterium]|tara:strand:- start:553 stop:1086 length:534 start_codon:yes stop_codon:yes gene_type:complete